jgi:hypothetical protein
MIIADTEQVIQNAALATSVASGAYWQPQRTTTASKCSTVLVATKSWNIAGLLRGNWLEGCQDWENWVVTFLVIRIFSIRVTAFSGILR